MQCPIYGTISDLDTFLKVSQGIISGTAEFFITITYFLFRFVTRVGDFPDEFSVISDPDGLLKPASRGGQYNSTISFGQTFMSTARAKKKKKGRETK